MLKKLFVLFTLLLTVSCNTIIIGDSMFAESPIKNYLEEDTGAIIENYALVGASLQKGWVKSIPDQYEDIKHLNPSTIIMDGGGNDVMSNLYACQRFNDNCRNMIDHVSLIARDLMINMTNNGVKYIVYLGFYYVKGVNKAIDYGSQKLIEVCNNITNNFNTTLDTTLNTNLRGNSNTSSNYGCYFTDPRNLSIPVGWDGLHPTVEGYQMLSQSIYNTIISNNITT